MVGPGTIGVPAAAPSILLMKALYSRSGLRSQTLLRFAAAAVLIGALAAMPWAAVAQAPTESSAAQPSAAVAQNASFETRLSPRIAFVDDSAITTYLSDVITWYRNVGSESRLVDHPEEVIFYATDQQIAREVLNLAFEAARAQVALNAKVNPSGAEEEANRSPLLRDLEAKAAQADAALASAQNRLKDLQAQLSSASKSQRAAISAQINSARGEAQLAQGRVDAIRSLLQYAQGLAAADHKSTGILAQIDQLQETISAGEKAARPAAAPMPASGWKDARGPDGIIGLASTYFALRGDSRTLHDSSLRIDEMLAKIEKFKAPVVRLLGAINDRGSELARKASGPEGGELNGSTREYRYLIELHDLAIKVASPLSKQEVQLALYRENLGRWQGSIDRYSYEALRRLGVRIATLFGFLALVMAGNHLWRRLGERFIHDEQRRLQVRQFSQPVFWVLVAFVLIVNFATELSSIATIMGLAAAGVALALQNVILSVAGYFFLIGKFGIRVGDRVQIGSTTGDVISIGLVKLTLMELSAQDRQPTGRVVVYSNAVVFQPNGNFFKQAPGMGFVWNEIRLTLAPDCDYRLAEKRVIDAVDEVFAHYRDRVERDFRYLGSDLHAMLETPRPQSRLQLTSSGLDMIVRYPADARATTQIADEVSRRVLDAIRREPGLKLVAPGPANIQPTASIADDGAASANEEPIAPNGGSRSLEKR